MPRTPTNYQANHELPEDLYLIYGHQLTVLITHAAVMVLHRCHPTASAVCMPRRLGSRPWPNKTCTTAFSQPSEQDLRSPAACGHDQRGSRAVAVPGVPGPGSRASEFAAAPRDPKGEPRRAQLRSAAVERRFAERSSSLQSCISSDNSSARMLTV